jgi:hypothetical protein
MILSACFHLLYMVLLKPVTEAEISLDAHMRSYKKDVPQVLTVRFLTPYRECYSEAS